MLGKKIIYQVVDYGATVVGRLCVGHVVEGETFSKKNFEIFQIFSFVSYQLGSKIDQA